MTIHSEAMTKPSDYVRLQVLVRPEYRNDRDLADVTAALRGLGFEVTGAGKASVSARATPEAFAAAFGGASPPAGDSVADDAPVLPMPAPLAQRVETITVAPAHVVISKRP